MRAALGGVLALSALLIAFNVDKTLQTKVGDYTPFLQKAERSCYTRKQLGQRCLTSQPASSSALKDYGPAPAFTGISTWINSKPLTVASLRGRVVLVDFWTYSCINCLRTLPHLKAWDAAYRKAGLTIVGVHTPEFAFEHVPSNVRKATRELGVDYPVAIDDELQDLGRLPERRLADRVPDRPEGSHPRDQGRRGHLRRDRAHDQEVARRARTGAARIGQGHHARASDHARVLPWLGTAAALLRFELVPDRIVPYKFPRSLALNTLAYDGLWRVERQRIDAVQRARLRLHFLAQNVYLVMSGRGTVNVLVDGKPVRTVRVGGLSRLYTLLSYPNLREGELELRFSPGVSGYAFTFG